jgi:peptide/nickel transport system permease protein
MFQYVAKRLLAMVPVLLGLTIVIFLIMRVIPGDAATVMLAESPTAQQKDELRRALGLDESLQVQYLKWLGGLARGDLGTSFWTNEPVSREIAKAAPVTLELSILSAILAAVVGVPMGVISAAKVGSPWDYATRSISIVGLSVPHFWLGTLALVLPAIWFGWTPPTQYRPIWEAPLYNLEQLWLPVLIIGFSASATLMRMTRSAMLEVLRQDYVRTARAKGLGALTVLMRHGLRNALIPVVTLFGTLFAGLLTGSVITETIFNLPGFGALIIASIGQRDYPLIQGCVLMFGILYSAINLLVDLSYAGLNPRIRYG